MHPFENRGCKCLSAAVRWTGGIILRQCEQGKFRQQSDALPAEIAFLLITRQKWDRHNNLACPDCKVSHRGQDRSNVGFPGSLGQNCSSSERNLLMPWLARIPPMPRRALSRRQELPKLNERISCGLLSGWNDDAGCRMGGTVRVACCDKHHKLYLAHLWFIYSLRRGNSITARCETNKKKFLFRFLEIEQLCRNGT